MSSAHSAIGEKNMPATRTAPKNIDEYIAACAPDVRAILKRIRLTVRNAVPDAQETISYRMPTFTLHGVLVHFAAFRKHIGLYPPVRGDAKLKKAILKFPLDQPIPYGLIERIVKHRAKQNSARRL
jgi:uncharacterized protein YdhG (YjbR/CyaY superfamily)